MIDVALDRWGTVDILVNNAWGGGGLARVENKTDADLEHAFAIGFDGPRWRCSGCSPR